MKRGEFINKDALEAISGVAATSLSTPALSKGKKRDRHFSIWQSRIAGPGT